MKMTKVRTLAQRPASNLSVIVKFLFGDKMPGEFQPWHLYQKGDTVYTVSEDGLTIKLWTCNISGRYPNTTEPCWTEFSISSYLDQRLVKIVRELHNPHPKMYSQNQSVGTYTVSNLMGNTLELSNTPSYMDVFYDGKLVSPSDYEIIDGELKSLIMPSESKVLVDNYVPSHELSRLIRRISYVKTVSKNPDGMMQGVVPILVSKDIIEQMNDVGELFVNGLFIPPEQWDIGIFAGDAESHIGGYYALQTYSKDGSVQKFNIGDKIVLNFMVSLSNNILVSYKYYETTINRDMDSYDIDISDSGYINVFQTMAVYINDNRVESSKFHFSKGFLNIKNREDYLKIGDTLRVSIYSFIPNEYVYSGPNQEDRRYITESIYITEDNTRLVPIPFLKFDEDLDDFIVFNENGSLVSSAKYYIDNNYIRYYSHDQGVYPGDTLNFKMVDRNKNTIMRTFILTAESDGQKRYTLPFNADKYNFLMIFYTGGTYLSPKEYTIVGDSLIFTRETRISEDPDNPTNSIETIRELAVGEGDRLEIIAFDYPAGVGSTLMEYHRIPVDEEVRNTFNLNFQYDPAVTSFLIFADSGLYIGEKFYEIKDNILTIKGEKVYKGGWIDIVTVQSTEALTSADNILSLL